MTRAGAQRRRARANRPEGGGGTSAWWAAVAAALIAYASLYPLTGWDHPAGWAAWREIRLPWPSRWTGFDVGANILGYAPLGALLWFALVRSGRWAPASGAVVALGLAAAFSAAMESLQNWLPGRVPSSMDLACNAAGAALGIALAAAVQGLGWADRWQRQHDRWFERGGAGATTLLLLWPLALLFPTPLPLGLGQVFGHLGGWIDELLAGTAMEPGLREVLAAFGFTPGEVAAPGGARPRLAPGAEIAAVAAALLAPCTVAYTIAPRGWRRAVLAVGGAGIAWGGLTLSAALNFAPQHALSWQTPQALAGIVLGTLAACALAWAPARGAAGIGLLAIGAMVGLVAQAPADPYFAVSLAAWEQGRFVRFHGVSQWIGWIWPFAAALYLLRRLTAAPTGQAS